MPIGIQPDLCSRCDQQKTLRQLPFIGKHSVPPRIRPDLWTAHCRVGPFPTREQGLNAFKKLRELRKLHELCWNKNNPEWASSTKKGLIRKIMDQKANAAADLARVLRIQASMGVKMEKMSHEREAQQLAYLNKRWAELDSKKKSIYSGKVEQLEKKIRDYKSELGNKLHDDKEVHRLNTAMGEARREIKSILWAEQIVLKHRNEQRRVNHVLQKQTEKLEKKKSAGIPEEELNYPTKQQNWVRTSLLPKSLQPLPAPFSLEGIEAHWADQYDAEYALNDWPENFPHATLSSIANRYREGGVITEDEYRQMLADQKAAVKKEMEIALEDLKIDAENKAENERRAAEGLPPVAPRENVLLKEVEEEPEKTGLSKYIPSWVPNPFKKASA
jgi:hypothetical protein